MKDVIRLKPRETFEDDVTYSEEMVELFLNEYTKPGDLVFDPFAGFGTTLIVAQRLGRKALGVELMPERVKEIKSRLKHPEWVVQGNAQQLDGLDIPPIDFSISSPPYMNAFDHPQNPLTGYETADGDYQRYLRELGMIYASVAERLKPEGLLAINVADIRTDRGVTPLSKDVTTAVAKQLELEREIEVLETPKPQRFDRDVCLVFHRRI